MKEPIFFQPIFKETIWGGEQLKRYGYDIPSDKTGECWVFSAHENGDSVVSSGKFKGLTLRELWNNHRGLFGDLKDDKFPFLVKIIDANDDLSVQVHPDDESGLKYGEAGKTECWYILDCEPDSSIIYGINASGKKELDKMIDEGRWNELLREKPIEKGDFIFVPGGTVHAIKAGTLILEIQQTSDVTYRLYDYDRVDSHGNKRELHIDKSKEVIKVPFVDEQFTEEVTQLEGVKITKLLESKYFTIYKYQIDGFVELIQNHPFMFCSIIEGEGYLEIDGVKYSVTKGNHFMLPSSIETLAFTGKLEIVMAHV